MTVPDEIRADLFVRKSTSDDRLRCAICGERVGDFMIQSDAFRGGVPCCDYCLPRVVAAMAQTRVLAEKVLREFRDANGLR